MKSSRIAGVIVMLAIVAGCAEETRRAEPVPVTRAIPVSSPAPPPAAAPIVIDEAGLRRFRGPGNGVLTGQGFVRLLTGAVVTCAATDIILVPATDQTREILDVYRARPSMPAPAQLREEPLSRYLRRAPCDAQGRFRFDRLADGTWIAYMSVWALTGFTTSSGGAQRSVAVTREIEIRGGRPTEIILSNRIDTGI